MLVSDQDSSITKINLKIFLAFGGVKTYLRFMAKTQDEAKRECEAAREAARMNPTVENREAAKRAWAVLESLSPPLKCNGATSRAGQRQAAERRAMHPWRKVGQ